ncbi:MAG: formylglycine-generating enzyme family protein [Planctomycetes bacterium]|jgi:formylglycine-generating enzyme required for sulfatase activity|nr:formylglycine-generating enzyme family protein [Planctomycetota bacterium]
MDLLLDVHPDLSASVVVPAGPFLFGEDLELRYLAPFEIDRYPVTISRYVEFLRRTGHPAPGSWPRGRTPVDRLDHPVTGVSHHDALAFARFLGRALPTEEQWEKAARGTDGRPWPWGFRFDVRLLNSRAARRRGTTPVDFYPAGASPYGVMDLSGNVWEWTSSYYDSECDLILLKGGCHALTREHARTTSRHFNEPGLSNGLTGFRTVLAL